jgi:tripartite-type tricarboxylate transporter receptor subunit TctC
MKRLKSKKGESSLRGSGMILFLAIAMAIHVIIPGIAWGAAKYPSSAVDIICPFAPGAATDQLTRLMAEELRVSLMK